MKTGHWFAWIATALHAAACLPADFFGGALSGSGSGAPSARKGPIHGQILDEAGKPAEGVKVTAILTRSV